MVCNLEVSIKLPFYVLILLSLNLAVKLLQLGFQNEMVRTGQNIKFVHTAPKSTTFRPKVPAASPRCESKHGQLIVSSSALHVVMRLRNWRLAACGGLSLLI